MLGPHTPIFPLGWIIGVFKAHRWPIYVARAETQCSLVYLIDSSSIIWNAAFENWIEVSTNMLINKNKAVSGHCMKDDFHVHKTFTGTKLKANINPLRMTFAKGKVGQ